MKIIRRKLSDLTRMEDNPRFIKTADFQILCQSLKNNPEHLEARPLILSNRTGRLVIIAGTQRSRALEENGETTAPTILLEGLTPEKEREIMLRDNVNNGSWDWDALANMPGVDLKDLQDFGIKVPDFVVNPPDLDPNPGESKSRSKLVHTCPQCGHQFKSPGK